MADISGIILYPAQIDIDLTQVSTIVFSITIDNNTESDLQYDIRVRPQLYTLNNTVDYSNWFEYPHTITIPAESSTTVPFSTTLPTDGITSGGYYPEIVFSPIPEYMNEVGINSEIASKLLLTVQSDLDEIATKAVIIKFSFAENFGLSPSGEFDILIANEGNVHFTPRGYISVFSPDNTRIWGEELTINDKFEVLLPTEELPETFSWYTNPQGLPNFRPYSAELRITDAYSGDILGTTTIQFTTYSGILVIIVAVGVSVICLLLVASMFVRRKKQNI